MDNLLAVVFPLAQRGGDEGIFAGMMAVFCGVFCVAGLIGIAILVAICMFLSGCLKRIPPQYRKQQPNMVWLLCIPLFGLVWNFFVYPKIAESFKAYFDANGRTDVGDCGRQISLVYCIVVCCSVIPYLGALAGIAALVLWIITLVKFSSLKNMIPEGTAA